MTSIDLSQAGQYFGVTVPEQLKGAAIRGLRRAAVRGLQLIVVKIIPGRQPPPVDRRTYVAGWKIESLADGAAIYNDEQHAAHIEWGVRASHVRVGRALLSALTEWVQRKGFLKQDEKPEDVAWAIAKSMQKRGIFNKFPGGGLQILQSVVDLWLQDFAREEIEREIEAENR